MYTVKRFDSFLDYHEATKPLFDSTFHYPFQEPAYLEVFAKHFCDSDSIYLLGLYDQDTLISAGAFEITDGTVLFLGMKKILGGQEVTDFGDIIISSEMATKEKVKAIWVVISEYFRQLGSHRIQLDYMMEDSPSYQYLATIKEAELTQDEVSPFILLPVTWDEYISKLPRVERKELKRKIKRLNLENYHQDCMETVSTTDFETFINLHRLSDPAKDKFMTESMKAFFWDIITAPKTSWSVRLCFLLIENKKVAAVLSFVNQDQVLLYNSGFDPAYSYYSVGLLLKAFRIKAAIEDNKRIYDFLRGNERYKYDLGASNFALWQINLSL